MERERMYLLQKFIQPGNKHPETIKMSDVVGMPISTISGAGDTTATIMTTIVFNLVTHPESMKTLRRELQHAEL
jgi:cytochrome P450